MKSLILISLYLFKDTLHRWKERPASPLSRVLVAFFLSLCALSFCELRSFLQDAA